MSLDPYRTPVERFSVYAPQAKPPAARTEPINLVATRPSWSQTFSSLKVRNYRIFAMANILAVTAARMQRVAQDWMVLQLSGSVTAVLALTNTLQVWHIYAIAFALGLVVVADQPARQVFVNELVGPRQLRNSVSLNSSIYQLGCIVGPVVNGILITAVGGSWAFVVNAGACVITVSSLLLIRTSELTVLTPIKRSKGQPKEG